MVYHIANYDKVLQKLENAYIAFICKNKLYGSKGFGSKEPLLTI